MSKPLKIAAGILACIVVALVILRVVGLNPQTRWPGLWLTGEVVETPVTDWTFLEKEEKERAGGTREESMAAVQTRHWFLPILPHSANYGWYVHKGQLYVNSAYAAGQVFPNGRYFHQNIVSDPHVRIKLFGKLYDGIMENVPEDERRQIQRERKQINTRPGMYSHIVRFTSMPND
jgi:hypothetical protein